MKILVVGAGHKGASVIRQLRKNPGVTVVVADWNKECVAVREGLIESIDIHAHVTPLNIKEILEDVAPDLVVLARSPKDWKHEDTVHGYQFISGMERELLDAPVPVLIIDSVMRGS